MFKNFLILFFFVFLSFIKSQTYRVIYDFKYKRDSLSEITNTSKMVLQIGEKNTKFYYHSLLKADSIYKRGSTISLSFPLNQIIKREKNSYINENYFSLKNNYFVYSSSDNIQWKITKLTKELNGYKVQQAETNWGGRIWIAWFCKDIPINEGPYKFNGLPGLIMEIEDTKKNFKYSLETLEKIVTEYNTENIVENNFGNKPLKINIERYNKLLLDNYNNPFDEYKNMKDGTWGLEIFDKEIRTQEGLKEIIKDYQKNIKKNYNPIELDKVVKY
ncbi:hypothetical protein BBI01_03365 [Chryseobacterium artocarpi]|uniref:GLPGLI family protein n=1 Tax=Chryseobacterium artocarpi TaxID=1414727 RepID=A0A1B9A0W7_9FLAO|nr:GLPGLI family protein [Chryseobacterium artocarpi]OCA77498.1 hypothetical protein BBI01_03365 [Chryseobacterium artocarpi]